MHCILRGMQNCQKGGGWGYCFLDFELELYFCMFSKLSVSKVPPVFTRWGGDWGGPSNFNIEDQIFEKL